MMDATKYAPGYYPVPAGYDSWVKKDHIEKAPAWCSVDLRDGNQALIVPMSLAEKLEFSRSERAVLRSFRRKGGCFFWNHPSPFQPPVPLCRCAAFPRPGEIYPKGVKSLCYFRRTTG